jgi:hypothetical protein
VYSLRALRDAINAHTELRAELVGEGAGLSLADGQLAEIPVVLLTYPPLENEWQPLCHYLLEGGFFIGYHQQARTIAEAFQAQGVADFHTAPLAADHPVFSALYDLQKPLPGGEENHVPALTGCFVLGRLAGVFAEGPLWSMPRASQRGPVLSASIKLTVNLMAYALQQEGSLTWKRQHPEGTVEADPAAIKK